MRVIVQPDYEQLSKWAAAHIAGRITAAKPSNKKPYVLGLPTGSSPIGTYKELAKLNKKGVVWQPVAVYDDGVAVYAKMPEEMRNYEAPVFHEIDQSGDEILVNYRLVDGTTTYKIDKLFRKGRFKIGVERKAREVFLFRIGNGIRRAADGSCAEGTYEFMGSGSNKKRSRGGNRR